METTFTLLFYPKKRNTYSNGPVDIYGRITISGVRSEFGTGLKCEPTKWDLVANRPKGNLENQKHFNAS